MNNEKGFTILETLLSVFIVSIALLALFLFISNINKVDDMSKENHYAEKLIEPYISYYQNLEIKQSEVNAYISNVERDNLEGSNKDYMVNNGIDKTPKSFRNLKVYCDKDVEVMDNRGKILGEEGFDEDLRTYLKFEIKCGVNKRTINKGKSFIVMKYIN